MCAFGVGRNPDGSTYTYFSCHCDPNDPHHLAELDWDDYMEEGQRILEWEIFKKYEPNRFRSIWKMRKHPVKTLGLAVNRIPATARRF